MSELEVLILLLVLLSPLFLGIGFFVGYRSGKANEQRQSIYDAKEQARETRIAIEEIRADERTKAIEDFVQAYIDDTNADCTDYCIRDDDFCCIRCFCVRYLEQLKEQNNVEKNQRLD